MLPCPYLPSEHDGNLQLKPQRQRCAPEVKNRQRAVRNADYEVDCTAIPEDAHPTSFSPRQLDGIIRHFEKTSEVPDVLQSDTPEQEKDDTNSESLTDALQPTT